jgi:uncharacterized protein (DUF302 family)
MKIKNTGTLLKICNFQKTKGGNPSLKKKILKKSRTTSVKVSWSVVLESDMRVVWSRVKSNQPIQELYKSSKKKNIEDIVFTQKNKVIVGIADSLLLLTITLEKL